MPSERLIWADILRVSAVFAVVLLHSAAPLLVQYRTEGPASWWIGNVYDSAVRWCVPLFVMLSGALLLGSNQPVGQFLARRFRRVAVPFVVWSVLYFCWAIFFKGRDLAVADFPRLLIDGSVYYHLWFFPMILTLYLLIPILRPFLRRTGRRGAWILVAAWIPIVTLLPVIADMRGWREAPESVDASPLRYAGYLVLGYLLRDALPNRQQTRAAVVLFVGAWALTAVGTWVLTVPLGGGRFDGLLYEYFAANVVLMTVAVFLLGRRAGARSSSGDLRAARLLRTASASALGVYVVHAMVIDLLKSGRLGLRIDQASVHPAVGIPLFALAVFGLSFAVVLTLRRIPVIGKVVP